MSFTRSPEIEAVARRILATWNKRDVETMSNLFSSDPNLRVLGFDLDEQWRGPEEFLKVFAAQSGEFPDWSIDVHEAEAFEDGSLGWPLCTRQLLLLRQKHRCATLRCSGWTEEPGR